MNKLWLFSLILVQAVLGLSGCGGGGGGGVNVDPNAPAAVSMTTSKVRALANGNDAVTIVAQVAKADGSPVADGTVVSFSAAVSGASFSSASAATANGLATTSLTLAPLTGANNVQVDVTGSAGGVSGSTQVMFINQPTSVDVFIGFDQPVTNLTSLQISLNNLAGASFDNATQQVVAVNSALGSLVAANFDAATNSTIIGLINAGGFNTGSAPIIKITFTVAQGAGLPAFSIANFTASGTPAANLEVSATFDTEL